MRSRRKRKESVKIQVKENSKGKCTKKQHSACEKAVRCCCYLKYEAEKRLEMQAGPDEAEPWVTG